MIIRTGLLKYAAIASVVALTTISATTQATPITFIGSGTGPGSVPVAASATFDISGDTLTIALQNTALPNNGQDVPGSTLSGLFWDFTGNPTLTPVSATIPTGSSIIQGNTCSTGSCANLTDVGGEWGYGTTVTGGSIPNGADRGIASSGYLKTGLPGNIGNFNNGAAGSDLDNPNSLNGINFGIISAAVGFNPNGGLSGEPLIQDTVVFILSGVSGLTIADISNVSFQYGTALTELNIEGNSPPPCTTCLGGGNPIPEPASASLFGLGLLVLGAIHRRKVA